jgi:hypothetical protein
MHQSFNQTLELMAFAKIVFLRYFVQKKMRKKPLRFDHLQKIVKKRPREGTSRLVLPPGSIRVIPRQQQIP